jgi:amino acid adenylation domain-containing protein
MPQHVDFLETLSRSVARRSEHVAVEASEGIFTYAQLDRLSNQLANRLHSLGVEQESRVGISLHRGALELVTMLATLKAGGAYVPLDPSHPADRLRGIVEDASPQVMVVNQGSSLATGAKVQTLVLNDIATATDGYPTAAPAVCHDPNQLAYVLFTSGSTGRPKGVEITRGGLANFLGSMAGSPGLAENERLLAITTTSFDIAGLELFLPLCVGATVVIADRETARDPRKLKGRLEAAGITMLQATPATWRLLLEAGWRGDGQLRMLCGGEALSPALADRLLAAGGELWNVYGPTETTVWSSLERILPGYDRITIGKPIDETQIYVLDEALNPVPIGQEGELWIGGKGLARGYRGRPDLTAERFVQNPHGPAGDRIYRTGDLGRRLADGRFECLGRLDHQVKVQGFRIELGEIETVLRKVSGVDEALVVADRQEDGDARLVAYWVGRAERDALIEAAQHGLPTYMVPAAYVPLQTFPLNTNGKIDRKQLPKPEIVETTKLPDQRQRTEIETRIASVWSQVLESDHVPLDQDFFTLGGTSVLAVKAVARIEKELGVKLPLQAFYDSPTVEGLAANIGKSFSPDAPIVARLRQGQSEQTPLFCVFGVSLYQDLALELAEDRPVFGVHVPFRYVPGQDRRPTLQEIGQRYANLIRRHQAHGPYHLLGLCFGGIVAYEVARQLVASGESVAAVTIIDAVLPHAIQIDQGKRWLSYLAQAWARPLEFQRTLRKRLRQRYKRSRLRSSFQTWLAPRDARQPIDLPLDGPEVDAQINRFAASPSRLPTRLLVVCATKEPRPEWSIVAPDQGWHGRAETVVLCNVPANHLGVLREPHVQMLAQAVSQISQT